MPIETPDSPENRAKVTKVFEFLKAYSELRNPPVKSVDQHEGVLDLQKDLPVCPEVDFRKAVKPGAPDEEDLVLRVTRPVLTECPSPSSDLIPWLEDGWANPLVEEARTSDSIPVRVGGEVHEETWPPSAALAAEFDKWQAARTEWREEEIPARRASALFSKLYEWHGTLQREGEAFEVVVADGMLTHGSDVRHPVLTAGVELDFLPDKHAPAFELRYRNATPELYVELLRNLPDSNAAQLKECIDEHRQVEFQPLAEDSTAFFRRLIQGLYREGAFVDEKDPESVRAAVGAVARIQRQPMILLRKRRTGLVTAFQSVIDDLANGKKPCSPGLVRILGLHTEVQSEQPSERPAEPALAPVLANEDEDVLFAKPANAEQSQIAKRLEKREAVLVQGPPGTGKTHTIANLVGHLLAQGKRVLVTAQTSKALRVLREKIVAPLRPLCVSVLQNDKQSQDELQASVKDIHERLSGDESAMEAKVFSLTIERKEVLADLRKARSEMVDARQDETRSIVFGGESIAPVTAAKFTKDGVGKHDWIPAPAMIGAVLPLSSAELESLYASNAIAPEDEIALTSGRPPEFRSWPTPETFRRTVAEMRDLQAKETKLRAELWEASANPHTLDRFEQMLADVHKTIDFLRDDEGWKLQAIQAGRDGEAATKVWNSLVAMIDQAWTEIQECRQRVIEHGPEITDARDPREIIVIVDRILEHHSAGKSFGAVAKLFHSDWYELAGRVKIGGRDMNLSNKEHVLALRALLRTMILREDLRARWERQITRAGGPSPEKLSAEPESVCRQFVPRIREALSWHSTIWESTERGFISIGFRWTAFIESSPPSFGEHADLKRLRQAVVTELAPILISRRDSLRLDALREQMNGWRRLIVSNCEPTAEAAAALRRALMSENCDAYDAAHRELERLAALEPQYANRVSLLERLKRSAPGWAKAIERRDGCHGQPVAPGPFDMAWKWRQLHDELERRAGTSLSAIQERIDSGSERLMAVTAKLIEAKTWLAQMKRTTEEQKRALGAYAALRSRLTKSGTGVRDAEVRNAARKEMVVAKDAVPVWIMPLAEAFTTFDPQRTRFDVVIVDESSQVDPCGLFALYLGDKAVIVGDDEQVTPITVGTAGEDVQSLIHLMLEGVPHNALYDGETSLYDLAQISFGGVIRLIEHFRCAPNIIAFSNNLSYRGTIRPLREGGSIPLNPHVIAHRVAGRETGKHTNHVEAEEIASLICAAIRDSRYRLNEDRKPTSFGVISLVGAQQAVLVESLLRQRLTPFEYQEHKILCGDSANFQGDERDVMFLSVVDGPPDAPPLAMRQEGAKRAFKKRFNVAASRARNQMWVVHSLNHDTDLQPGDYRRRLIEHAMDPGAWERDFLATVQQVDPRSKVFEGGVLRHLMSRGYKVQPQYPMGAYSIDLMVIGKSGNRLAVECDGEAFHGIDQLQQDLNRQAILERLGLKFERIRGSVYFRDEERALKPVFARLESLGIEPMAATEVQPAEVKDAFHVDLIRAAEALRADWAKNPVVEMFSDTGRPSGRGWGRRRNRSAETPPAEPAPPPAPAAPATPQPILPEFVAQPPRTVPRTPVQEVLRMSSPQPMRLDRDIEAAVLQYVREKKDVGMGSLVVEMNRRFSLENGHSKVEAAVKRLADQRLVVNGAGFVRLRTS